MHVGKPYDQQSLTSHMPGQRALEMPRPAPVGAMVIDKTLGTRQLNLRFFFFGFWSTDHRVIAVNSKFQPADLLRSQNKVIVMTILSWNAEFEPALKKMKTTPIDSRI